MARLPAAVGDLSPWVDLRVPPTGQSKEQIVEGLTNRRFLKTHLPTSMDTPRTPKYVYVARDGRDAFMSLMNRYKNGNEAWYGALNSEGLVGDPLPSWEKASENKDGDDDAVFDKWLNTLPGTRALRGRGRLAVLVALLQRQDVVGAYANVLFVHFGDMKQDLSADAAHVRSSARPWTRPSSTRRCACVRGDENCAPPAPSRRWAAPWGGAETFINKGTSGRWKDVLTKARSRRTTRRRRARLSKDCADWLAGGGDALPNTEFDFFEAARERDATTAARERTTPRRSRDARHVPYVT